MTGDGEVLTAALAEFVTVFDEVCNTASSSLSAAGPPSCVLNGQASAEIRRLVPLDELRRLGAFFTPHELADELADPLRSAHGQVTVVDPCCGAGDLLLAATRALEEPVRRGTASATLVGVDIVDEFSAGGPGYGSSYLGAHWASMWPVVSASATGCPSEMSATRRMCCSTRPSLRFRAARTASGPGARSMAQLTFSLALSCGWDQGLRF